MGKKILVLCMVIALLILLPVFSYADLPSGYTELEYIQSSGTQYIDTGFVPTVNTTVNFDFQFPSSPSSQNCLFGARGVITNNTTRFTCIYNLTNDYISFAYGSSAVNTGNDITDFTIPFSLSFGKDGASINDFSYPVSGSYSPVSQSLYLFNYNSNGSPSSTYSLIKLFSSSIEDNGVLVRDFIPCINSSNVIGLWDDVNSVFYDNDGTGTFIAGPVVVPPNPEYSISVSSDGNGSVASNVSTATAGSTVSLTATPDDGYVFSEWEVLQGDIDIVNNQFIMPSSNVSINAVFVPDGAYSVTVQNDGFGTGSANPVRAQAGDRVTLSAVPALGYEFDKWQVVSGSVNISNNQFIMPDSDVVVKALFKPIVYTITLNQSPNGTATVSQQTGIIGDVITLTATPNEYYNFLYWDVMQGGITVDGNSFTMPASNVVLTPVFVKQSAVSSGFTFNSGVYDDNDISARQGLADINFGNQPAGEYLINIYTYGQNYGVSYDIGVGSDTTTTRKLPYTQSGGVTTALYTHLGGEMVLDLNFTYYKSVLNSPAVWYAFFDEGTASLSTSITSSGNYIFNIIDVVATPTGLANSEDYGIYGSIVSFLKSQLNDIKSFLTEQIGRIAGDEEAEADVSQAEEELNKEVEDLNNLGGQLSEEQSNLETQFETDFKVSDDISSQTSTFQGIYSGLFSSLGVFSIFIWLPVVFSVIKKLLRL